MELSVPWVHPPVDELTQSSLEGKGVVRVKHHVAGPWRIAGAVGDARWLAVGPPHLVSIYTVVKDPRRGKRQARNEPRAQEYMEILWECRRKRQCSGEARVPKSILQQGKKGIRSLINFFI